MRAILLTLQVAFAVLGSGWNPLPAASASGGARSADTAWVHVGPGAIGPRAFVASPPGQGPAPALIVVHEWWELEGQIHEVARRLSLQGYVVVVPDLGPGRNVDRDALPRTIDPEGAFDDLDASVHWVRAQPRTAKGRLGVIGFGPGGSISLEYALRRPVAAAVLFDELPATDPRKLEPLGAPVQGHFGAADPAVSSERVEAFRAAMKQAGKSAEIYLYPSAGHAFLHEGSDSYHADAARQAWARLLAFLQRTLKG